MTLGIRFTVEAAVPENVENDPIALMHVVSDVQHRFSKAFGRRGIVEWNFTNEIFNPWVWNNAPS